MKKVLLILLSIFLVACTEVTFPTHQPKGIQALTEFPPELRGRYTANDQDTLQDTLQIEKLSYRFLGNASAKPESWLDHGHLSDSLIVKKYKGFFFLNFKEDNQWMLRVIKQKSNGDLSFRSFAIDGANRDKLLYEFQQEIPVEVIQKGTDEKYYLIDPSPKKLLQLIKKKKYWEESNLKKIK